MRRFLIPFILLILVLSVAIAFRHPPVNPPVVHSRSLESNLRPPQRVSNMLRRACYDCHSNETKWPWYSRVPGFGDMLIKDVTNARATFNFSEWAAGPYGKPRVGAAMLMGMCSAIRAGQMPRTNYLMLHPNALPTPAEVDEFCVWGRTEAKRLVDAARRKPAQHAQPAAGVQFLRIARKPD